MKLQYEDFFIWSIISKCDTPSFHRGDGDKKFEFFF